MASENFSKLSQSAVVLLSTRAMYSLMVLTISRARSTTKYETCVLRRKDTTSRPMTWRSHLIASVAAKLLPVKSVRLRGTLAGAGTGPVGGGSGLLGTVSDGDDPRSEKDEASLIDGLEGVEDAVGRPAMGKFGEVQVDEGRGRGKTVRWRTI
jgi:hypothetical protein